MVAGKLVLIRKGRRAKRKANVKSLDKRVRQLEMAKDRITVTTDKDDSDVFATPVVEKLNMVHGNSGSGLITLIDIRGVIEQKNDLADSVLTRICVIRDLYNSDTANDTPVWLDVFAENEIFTQRKIDDVTKDYNNRFTVPYDRVFKTTRDLEGTIDSKIHFHWKKRYKGLKVIMADSKGKNNGFYLFMISTGVTTDIDVSTSSRVTYKEIDSIT